MNESSNYLTGPDRIEMHPILGRPIRMGAPDALSVSDEERIRQALEEKNSERALQYLGLSNVILTGITNTFLEWCLALPNVLNQSHPEECVQIIQKSFELWKEGVDRSQESYASQAIEFLTEVLAPESISPESVTDYRRGVEAEGSPHIGWSMLTEVEKGYQELIARIETDASESLAENVREHLFQLRSRHDLCGQYVSTVLSMMAESIGQKKAALLGQEALESCLLLQGMWDVFAKLDPPSLTLFLAEHLRGHFSGPGRSCAVQVSEEEDRYRLIFDPCGTGGAMRRNNVPGLQLFTEEAPETWGLSDCVPSYCSHCALNEVTSLSRLGRLAWVTEFRSDPDEPCGWTVYKDESSVPESYFQRIR